MNVVIVGAGKAGFLHFNSYYKLYRIGLVDLTKIFFVDTTGSFGVDISKLIHITARSYKVYKTFDSLLNEEQLVPENTIIDLCIPRGTFTKSMQTISKYGFSNFLVEKPFVIFEESRESNQFNKLLSKVKIIKIENYLHSKVHKAIKHLIDKYNLELSTVVTNFSKNRQSESLQGRAFRLGEAPPSVFEIEVPHQIYICNDLFGDIDELIHVYSKDMIVDGNIIKKHGEGLVVGKNSQNALYIHYSNLCFNRVYRTIDIFFKNNYYLHGIYVPVCEDELGVKAGVVLSNGSQVIESYFFDDDDNMLDMISYAFSGFQNDCYDKYAFPSQILNFSNLMKNVLNFEAQNPDLHSFNYQDSNFDVMQIWLLQMFIATRLEPEQDFLAFLEKVKIKYFKNKYRNLVASK